MKSFQDLLEQNSLKYRGIQSKSQTVGIFLHVCHPVGRILEKEKARNVPSKKSNEYTAIKHVRATRNGKDVFRTTATFTD